MLRGFAMNTNATLQELLASDTDNAEDPGTDSKDVEAFVRAASPLFGASGEDGAPWTHETIRPPEGAATPASPATPPRSPEVEATPPDAGPCAPTTPAAGPPAAFHASAATATAALQRMLDASPQASPVAAVIDRSSPPTSPLRNCTGDARDAAAGVGTESPTAAKRRLAELLQDSSDDEAALPPPVNPSPPNHQKTDAQLLESIETLIEDPRPPTMMEEAASRAKAALTTVVDTILPPTPERAPTPSFDEEGDDSDGEPVETAPAPPPAAIEAPAAAPVAPTDDSASDGEVEALWPTTTPVAPAAAPVALEPADDSDCEVDRLWPAHKAPVALADDGASDGEGEHQAPLQLQPEVTPPASAPLQPFSASSVASSRWETEDVSRPNSPESQPRRKSLKKLFASGAKGLKKRLIGKPKIVGDLAEHSDEDKRSSTSSNKRPEEISEYAADLEKKLALLQAHAGLNDDELEWKLASTETADPYGLAKTERERAEGEYDKLMWDESKHTMVARLADDAAVFRALDDVVASAAIARATAAADFERSSAAHAAQVALATKPVKEKASMAREDAARAVGAHEAFDVDEDASVPEARQVKTPTGEGGSAGGFSEMMEAAAPPDAAPPSDAARPPHPLMGGKGKGRAPMAGGLLAALAGRGRGGRGPMAGGLAAAIAGRGRGRGPMAGGLAAALAGRGRGGLGAALAAPKLRKPKTLKTAKAALVKARARAAQDAEKLPVQLPEFSIVVTATAAVMEALAKVEEAGDERRRASATMRQCDAAAAAAACALAQLRDAAKTARREGQRLQTNLRDVEGALDVWRARERDAPNRMSALAEDDLEWSRREQAANAAALALIRTLVPPDIQGDTVESLRHRAARVVAQAAAAAKRRKREAKGETNVEEEPVSDRKALAIAAAWGGCYTFALAERLKTARPLHWVQAHPDDVATSNFLNGAGADSFKNLGDYDVVELRAIYAACPEKFQLDASGAKATWRRQLVERLRELVARERGDRVAAGWDGATGSRRTQQLPPLPAKQRRHPAYYYPSKAGLEETAEKHKTLKNRRDERKKKVATLEAALDERRDERDAAFADSRSEYLQQQYGRQLLRDLAREADNAYKATSKELGNDVSGARADYLRAAKAVDSAKPTEAEDAALRKLVERHALCDGDALADATDVAALRRRALAKAGIPDEDGDVAGENDERVGRHVFADQPRGRLVRGPFDPWPEIGRAARAPVMKKLSDEEEARLRREELKQHGARRKSLSTKEVAKTLAASSTLSARPTVRRAAAKPAAGAALAPVAPRSRRLAELARKSAGSEGVPSPAGSSEGGGGV